MQASQVTNPFDCDIVESQAESNQMLPSLCSFFDFTLLTWPESYNYGVRLITREIRAQLFKARLR